MKLYSIAVFALLGLGLSYLVWWGGLPNQRYQALPDHYRLIYGQEGAVDIAAVGSSRLMSAFNANLMADLLERRAGRKIVAYDLSKSWVGNGITYILVRDLLERRKVGCLLIDYKYTGGWINPLFHEAAGLADIFESGFTRDDLALPARLQDALNLSIKKYSKLATLTLSGELKDLSGKAMKPAQTSELIPVHLIVPTRVFSLTLQEYKTWTKKPEVTWPLSLLSEARNRHYLKRIVELAQSKGTKVYFVNLPRLYSRSLTEGMARSVEAEFGVRLLRLPPKELAHLYPLGFADAFHLNRRGMNVYTRWLAGELEID